MAIPKKGSRKIVVDDVVYRWRIRWKPTIPTQDYFLSGLLAAVELYDDPQSVLYVGCTWSSYKHYPALEVEPVTPKQIESAIRNALKAGWQPERKGYFHLIQGKNQEFQIVNETQT